MSRGATPCAGSLVGVQEVMLKAVPTRGGAQAALPGAPVMQEGRLPHRVFWQMGMLSSAVGPCCLCSSFPEPAGRFGARYLSIYPPSYTTGEARGSLLILAHLLHLELSSSGKDEADSKWVLPSHGELLASMWFP